MTSQDDGDWSTSDRCFLWVLPHGIRGWVSKSGAYPKMSSSWTCRMMNWPVFIILVKINNHHGLPLSDSLNLVLSNDKQLIIMHNYITTITHWPTFIYHPLTNLYLPPTDPPLSTTHWLTFIYHPLAHLMYHLLLHLYLPLTDPPLSTTHWPTFIYHLLTHLYLSPTDPPLSTTHWLTFIYHLLTHLYLPPTDPPLSITDPFYNIWHRVQMHIYQLPPTVRTTICASCQWICLPLSAHSVTTCQLLDTRQQQLQHLTS